MARNLVAAGARVGLTGRTPAKAASLVEAGAVWHDSPRSLAADAGVIVLMLPDLPEVEAVLDGPDGILAASPRDLVLVISSTSSPDGVRALHRRLADRTAGAVRVVDAPVSGGTDGATAGTLSIMVGGADADVARVLPVLRACGNAGAPGAAGRRAGGEGVQPDDRGRRRSWPSARPPCSPTAAGWTWPCCSTCSPAATPAAASSPPAGSGSSPRTTARPVRPSTWSRTSTSPPPIAAATDSHPVLLPAVRAAFEELVARGLGDLDIAVTRRFIDQR